MDELAPLTPVNFFQLAFSCRYLPVREEFPTLSSKSAQKYLLPDTSVLCSERHFADVSMGWNEEGLEFYFDIAKPFEEARYPDSAKGDSVEIFIDTRDVKTSGFNTRFCHHFFFLPEAVEGHQAGEITHFRTEDAHDLCKPSDLLVKGIMNSRKYAIHCRIPKVCLLGFDPRQFDRIGFNYRINRPRREAQHLSVVSEDYQIEQQPSLWSRMRLIK